MPPSYTPGPCCGTPSYESWSIVTLPYYEEQALHDLYNFEVPNEDPAQPRKWFKPAWHSHLPFETKVPTRLVFRER